MAFRRARKCRKMSGGFIVFDENGVVHEIAKQFAEKSLSGRSPHNVLSFKACGATEVAPFQRKSRIPVQSTLTRSGQSS
jgi:hypothetical protein